ncbi:hypothetical protein OOK36_56860 [Streptomyces sp. NBC_00365]|uniref:hypothetical protein n=1 Tax=Streptomyces sp. NBC_00365 TaxID=2975726 RepID=UPI00224C979B|nr:hypothetical protein [Streptomyces sp. NBC_00365]MCX5097907.1 hypothetical protein [Streptomyces sp. NBC_00365]
MAGGLYREVEERGRNHEWGPFPRQAKAQGRSAGSPNGVWREPVIVRLPAELVHIVYAACRHTSKEARDLLVSRLPNRNREAVPARGGRGETRT